MRKAKALFGAIAIGLLFYAWIGFLNPDFWDLANKFPFRHFISREGTNQGVYDPLDVKSLSNQLELSRNPIVSTESPSKYLLDTPACKLPVTSIMSEYYKKNWNWEEEMVPDCRGELHIMTFLKEDESVEVKYFDPDICTMHEFIRHDDSDNYDVIDHGKVIERHFNVSGMDMIKCNGSASFEANIRTGKDTIQEKLNYWREKEGRPINVLILGLDTVSRSHFHRSLPKTLKILDQMGFVDFQGFHSAGQNTWPNFCAFLMGQTEEEVEASCRPSWFDTADACPIIWKTFDAHKYVTLFLDDWLGTFQYDRTGFSKQPTDYYLHPLFKHLWESRENKTDESRDCVSSEPLPSFMLRYTERFLRKFEKTPFFALNWITMPLHEFPFALPNMDQRLSEFCQFIQTNPDIYENTLIIIMADHGERYGNFSYGSTEGFMERVLPPLFIRVPESLNVTHPEINFEEVLKINRKRLTTGFDIHQTLLHTLELSGLMSISNETNPTDFLNPAVFKDSSSLFVPIGVHRDCSTVKIPARSCVCNSTISSSEPVKNPELILKLLDFVTEKLNSVVEESKYSGKCETWKHNPDSLISADVLQRAGDLERILIKCALLPNGNFEADIQFNRTQESENLVLVSDISRINAYRNSSWCVVADTIKGKKMKNYCSCLNEEPSDLDGSKSVVEGEGKAKAPPPDLTSPDEVRTSLPAYQTSSEEPVQ